jgi:hypothetical protein
MGQRDRGACGRAVDLEHVERCGAEAGGERWQRGHCAEQGKDTAAGDDGLGVHRVFLTSRGCGMDGSPVSGWLGHKEIYNRSNRHTRSRR